MGSNNPRRNHYIAQMLLLNFADDNRCLQVLNKEKGKPFRSKVRKAFVEKRRYVRYRDGGEQDNYEVEEKLSKIEGAAAPVIRKIIVSARKGEFPKLVPEHWNAWKRFFFTSLLRAPKHATQILNELGSEQALDEAINRVLQEHGLPPPGRRLYDLDPRWANVKEMIRHNTTADLAAGLPPQVNSEIERYAHEVGLLIGVVQDPDIELIIGSCAAVYLASQSENDPMPGTWLPISYDIAIGLTAFPDRETKRPLSSAEVQRINNASYEQSEIIAARSKSQLRPFMQKT